MWVECCGAKVPTLVNSDNVAYFEVDRISGGNECFAVVAWLAGCEGDWVCMGWYDKSTAELALIELYDALARGDKVFDMPDQQDIQRKWGKVLGIEE